MHIIRTEEEVVELAAKHWDKEDEKSFVAPQAYLRTLRDHLRHFPKDDFFVLTPHGGAHGCGVLTCLEPSCYQDIELGPDVYSPDGGKALGVGDLTAFHEHIMRSPGHKTSRDARFKDYVAPRSTAAPTPTPAKVAKRTVVDLLGIKPSPTPRKLPPSLKRELKVEEGDGNGDGEHDEKRLRSFSSGSGAALVVKDTNRGSQGKREDDGDVEVVSSSQDKGKAKLWESVKQDKAKAKAAREKQKEKEKKEKAKKKKHLKDARGYGRGYESERSEDDSMSDGSYDTEDERRASMFAAGSSSLGGGMGRGSDAVLDTAQLHRAIKASSDFMDNATVGKAREELGLKSDSKEEVIDGMVTYLKPHQHLGVAWALNQERGPHRGGILGMIWESKITKVRRLQKYDVILTTYHTMMNDFPDRKKLDDLIGPGGPMKRMKFYRVILDEGQFIRNRNTRASLAAASLISRYRWVCTGTPITNSLDDVYGLIRFLGIRPYNEWDHFRDRITKRQKSDPDAAAKCIQILLATCMLRRLKTALLDGQKLIDLNSVKTIEDIPVDFAPEEQEIYDFVFEHSQGVINKFLRKGTILKNYSNVLEHLLRLRQLCNHPHLIVEHMEAIATAEEKAKRESNEDSSTLYRAQKELGYDVVAKFKRNLEDQIKAGMQAEANGGEAASIESECPACNEPLGSDSVFTKCGHEFCRECIDDWIQHCIESADGNEQAGTCPTCRTLITKNQLYLRRAFMPADEPEAPVAGPSGTTGAAAITDIDDVDLPDTLLPSNVIAAAAANDVKPAGQTVKRSTLEAYNKLPQMTPAMASSKMKYLAKILTVEKPEEKVLVLTQWTSFIDLLDDFLTNLGYTVVRFQGDMNPAQRSDAVDAFQGKNRAKIMLMSLKCGGVGLNLTRGNHVISLDLAWSKAVEAQAFDRCHRLGQVRDVAVRRPIINNSVEQKIIALQEKKGQLSDASLGEGSGKKLGRLTVSEIANLFGLPRHGLPI